jgi:F-type H+-transporting ATPase subunit b
MHPDGWTFLFQSVNFVALVGLLWWFLYRPISTGIARRQAEVTRALDEAAAAAAQVEQLKAEYARRQTELQAEEAQRRRAIIAATEAERTAALAAIRAEGDRLLAAERERLAVERSEAERTLRHEAATLADHIVRRLTVDLAGRDPAIVCRERVTAALQALDAAQREVIARAVAAGDTIDIATAHTLTATAQAELIADWATLLALPPTAFRCVVRPDLIVGYDIRLPGHVVAFHWSGQLDRLRQEVVDGHAR